MLWTFSVITPCIFENNLYIPVKMSHSSPCFFDARPRPRLIFVSQRACLFVLIIVSCFDYKRTLVSASIANWLQLVVVFA